MYEVKQDYKDSQYDDLHWLKNVVIAALVTIIYAMWGLI